MPRTVESIKKADEEKIDLEDQNDAGAEGAVDTKTANNDDKGPTPEEVAADLRKQLDEANAKLAREQKARQDAETSAAGAASKQRDAVTSEIATREAAIASKKSAAETKLASIKAQLKQAVASDDKEAIVDLQDEMTNARYEFNAASWEETNFKAWKEDQARLAERAKTQAASNSPYTPAEQDWIGKHPEFNTSKKFARVAKLAAQEAKDEGHTQDSRGYFDYIEGALKEEGFLGGTKDPTSGAADDANAASTATPPNRNGQAGAVQVPSKNSKYPYIPKGFTIPKEWVIAAQEQGFEGNDGALEYANERLKIEAEEKGRG